MATDVARLALQIDVSGAQRAKQALAGLQDGSIRATRATNQLTASTTRMAAVTRSSAGAFRFQKGAIQQVGYQVGDFATQVSAGQSAIVAFGQQASQLAGIMGPGGALLGAVIAIGSGIAGAFVRSMMDGEEATKDLSKQMRELAKELGYVSDRQRDIINTGYAQTIAEQTRNIEEQRAAIYEANRNAETFFRNQLRAGVPAAVIEASEAWKNLIAPVENAKDAIAGYQQVIDATEKEREEFWKNLGKTGDTAEDTAEKIQEMVSAAEQQAATIGLSARAIATYEAALAGANAEQILAIDAAYRRIEAEQAAQAELKRTAQQEAAQRKAMMAATEIGVEDDPLLQRIEAEKRGQQILLRQQKNYATARSNLDQQILASATSTAGNLANAVGQLAGEQSNAYRAAFLVQQGFAIASAIVSTQLAAAAALAPPPIGLGPIAGLPYAGTIEALGAANVAIIAGQTVAGLAATYDGGGYTGNGSRTGGLDGKGGFMAMMHPQETVIDHTKGQGMGGGTVINIHNAKPGTRTEERTDSKGRQVVDVFLADMASGGPMAKSIQGTYGLKRQGR